MTFLPHNRSSRIKFNLHTKVDAETMPTLDFEFIGDIKHTGNYEHVGTYTNGNTTIDSNNVGSTNLDATTSLKVNSKEVDGHVHGGVTSGPSNTGAF